MFEKVNPCHPDKVADRIAGAVVDMAYARETDPKIAVEVLIGHGVCHIIAETSTSIDRGAISEAVHRIAGKSNILLRPHRHYNTQEPAITEEFIWHKNPQAERKQFRPIKLHNRRLLI